MSDIIAAPPTPTTPTTAAQPVSLLGTINDPPGDVARLAIGHLLRGVVSGHDATGKLLVRTDYGTLAVTTQNPTPPSGEVVLQIRSAGARLQVLILQAESSATKPPVATSSDVLTLGQSVRAVLQAPPPGTSGLPTALTQLPVGSQLQLRVISAAAPSAPQGAIPASTPQPSHAAATTAAPQTPSLSQQPSGTAGRALAIAIQGLGQQAAAAVSPPPAAAHLATPTQGAALPQGTVSAPQPNALPRGPAAAPQALQSQAQPSRMTAGGATASAAPPQPTSASAGSSTGASAATAPTPAFASSLAAPTAGNPAPTFPGALPASQVPGAVAAQPFRFTAQVSAVSHAGQPIVQTPVGTLTLEMRAPLPPGSSLVLEVVPASLAKAPATGALQNAWPSVDEILAQAQAAGIDKSEALARLIPQAGPKLASSLLFLLSALRGGDVAGFLGNRLAPLAAGTPHELASRLNRDVGRMTRQVDGAGGEWRLFLLPFLDNGELEPLRFFLRDQPGETPDNEHGQTPDDATRFVIEIELSKIGGLQIDGLVHHKRFDLILRTERPLPQAMRHHISEIYQSANEAAGLGGRIAFETPKPWHFLAVEDHDTEAHAGLVV